MLYSKAFRLADRLVSFSIFDVTLLTSLLVTGINFDDDTLTTEFGDMVRHRVHQEQEEELRRRKVGSRSKDNSEFKNFVATITYLCEKNAVEELFELWLKLYTWFVLSGLLFPHSMCRATWELQRYANDVHRMSRYVWMKTI